MASSKKAVSFPKWAEGLLVVALLVMAWVEMTHGQWIWAGIFGVCGALFGANLGARMISGEQHGDE
jgi:hypothetical protein